MVDTRKRDAIVGLWKLRGSPGKASARENSLVVTAASRLIHMKNPSQKGSDLSDRWVTCPACGCFSMMRRSQGPRMYKGKRCGYYVAKCRVWGKRLLKEGLMVEDGYKVFIDHTRPCVNRHMLKLMKERGLSKDDALAAVLIK